MSGSGRANYGRANNAHDIRHFTSYHPVTPMRVCHCVPAPNSGALTSKHMWVVSPAVHRATAMRHGSQPCICHLSLLHQPSQLSPTPEFAVNAGSNPRRPSPTTQDQCSLASSPNPQVHDKRKVPFQRGLQKHMTHTATNQSLAAAVAPSLANQALRSLQLVPTVVRA